MADAKGIINAIDEFLERKHQKTTTPVEIGAYLEKQGMLKDSTSRPGSPLRDILRKGKIPHAYQVGTKWLIPHSKNASKILIPIITPKAEKKIKPIVIKEESNGHKLIPIADLIKRLLEKKYNNKASCIYEHKPDWLLTNPTKQLIKKHPELSELYSELIDNKFKLIEKIEELTDRQINQKQSFDIWIDEPFNFAVEFDEDQHFNQFRKITLNYYKKIEIKYPLIVYKELNQEAKIKEGKSGFTKLKSKDPLFPEMLEGDNQDNRIRQRAFRDYLKDLLPIENGFKPTLRIPYFVTNKKKSDFTETDLKNVENYIMDNNLI
ncbi:MAG TPA: hypothetical protein VLZ75_09695 [Chitinophagales bacterium]|nr:hypothetical protein [Chitinophagales bacterium]